MRNINALVLIACITFFSCEERTPISATSSSEETDIVVYDSLLALELGADDYGMSQYVMAFLKKGPNRPENEEKAASLQKAHLENINKMATEGKLVLAGPFMDDGEIRGIYIFKVGSVDEAEELTATDPAIQAGSLIMELHPWYGSAALPMVNEWHKKLAKLSF